MRIYLKIYRIENTVFAYYVTHNINMMQFFSRPYELGKYAKRRTATA
jgi:hypothetical protein